MFTGSFTNYNGQILDLVNSEKDTLGDELFREEYCEDEMWKG